MAQVDTWLHARFSLLSDPWECLIGAYGTMTSTFGLSEDQAMEKIKEYCQRYWGPEGIQRQEATRALLFGSSRHIRPDLCNES